MPETQVVTVLFTDLVDSTRQSTRLDPEVGDRLRETHFGLLRGALESNGGTEVKNLGDGLMVVFTITSGALNAAEAMQQAVALHNARASEPLSIRIGIAMGEVTEDEGDYFGDAVVEAARLCAKAEGDQVLASRLVQLTAGRRAKQSFGPVSELELKGLPDLVPTVEVLWSPLESTDAADRIPLPVRCSATTTGFFGRADEQARLGDAFKAVVAEQHTRVALIGGEPGMGKTSLATQFARSAHDGGAIVLFGRADEDVAAPYGPWVEALIHLARHAPARLLEELDPYAPSLARLSPVFATQLGVTHLDEGGDPEGARYLLYAAVAAALRAAAAIAPVVLILDDIQWADGPSLRLLRHLAADEPLGALIIGTFRQSDVTIGSDLSELVSSLHRSDVAERISMAGLTDLELLSMMEGVGGHELDADGLALRDALLAETDGNPFFVGELLRHLVESGGIYREDDRWVTSADLRIRGLPVSVREVVAQRVGRLGERGTRVLTVASVIGRDFDLSVLAAVSELDEDTLLDVLDQATDATLVENVEGNRYTFIHALIEHTLYDGLPPARRARLHRRVAEAIEGLRGAGGSRAAELAHHWASATAPDDVDKAISYAQLAGEEALSRLAPEEAARWFGQALTLLGARRNTDEEARCLLTLRLGEAQRQSGDPSYRVTLLDAAGLAQQLGRTDLLVVAALTNTRGIPTTAGADAERLAVLEVAARAVDGEGSAEQAKILALLCSELTFRGTFERRQALADRALAIARSVGDPQTLATVITNLIYGITVPSTLAERRALAAEALRAAHEVGDPALEFWGWWCTMSAAYQAIDVDAGDVALAELTRLAEEMAQPNLQWLVAASYANRALLAGDLDEAERRAFSTRERGVATGQPDALLVVAAQLGNIKIRQGRLVEALEMLETAVAANPDVPAVRSALAALYCDVDRPDDARAQLAPLVEDGFSVAVDSVWMTCLGTAADAASELEWPEAAAALFAHLRPFGDQLIYQGSTSAHAVAYYLARLAAVLGLDDEAAENFARSDATHQRIGARYGLALTWLAWGSWLVGRGDRQRGGALLEQALAEASDRGYQTIARRAADALAGFARPPQVEP
ncbi:MAG TPA: AAA family ATPase [Acidimicrobiales bacterium]|jgi:class 3 adenylate cyclase/tetratricopeptide (TPR) repeat protein